MTTPTSLSNRALDQIGAEGVLGDITDGTRAAQLCLRQYNPCRQQLLRAANWNFARKDAPLVMLAARGGNIPNVATQVIYPWLYEYEYPIDCMRARCVPLNSRFDLAPPPGNIVPTNPLPPAGIYPAPFWGGGQIQPARWLEAVDPNYPSIQGQIFWESRGSSPAGRTVILTDVCYAHLIYTCDVIYPNMWDPLFEEAFVSLIASWIALPLNKDKKLGMALRREQIAITKEKVSAARAADGNEAVGGTDLAVDWMRARRAGGTSGSNFGGIGGFAGGGYPGGGSWAGYGGLALADGTVF